MNTEACRYNDYEKSFSIIAPGHHKMRLAFVILAILFFITSYRCLHTCSHCFCHSVRNNKNTYCFSHFTQYVKWRLCFNNSYENKDDFFTFLPEQDPKEALSIVLIYSVITY